MAVYYADDFFQPAVSASNSTTVSRQFKCTVPTMLASGGAAGFIAQDIIGLCPIPGMAIIEEFRVGIPVIDTGTTVTVDVGDNLVLPGAVVGQVSGNQVTPATPNATFTLTLTASTAGFAAGGLVMIGGVPYTYAAVAGSTLTGVRSALPNYTIPNLAWVQQAGNIAAYQNTAVVGRAASVLTQDASIVGATVSGATAVANNVCALYPQPINGSGGFGLGNIGTIILLLHIRGAPTGNPAFTAASQFTGWVHYHMPGYQP